MSEAPLVTVLIPARNEEADIARCLEAVLAQDYAHDRMEIVLVDGGSVDATAGVAARTLADGDVDWKIIDNPMGTTPSNLNAGLAVASGSVLCRVDARSIIPPEYVRLCVEVLARRPDVAVTGGAQVTWAPSTSTRALGISRALNNRFAVGGASYRSGASSGPTDTVYLGSFRTADLRTATGWDEAMLSNQDFELNRRLGRSRVVWFDARIAVGYRPRRTFVTLAKQYHRFGRWKVRYWRHTGDLPRPRQAIPLGAVLSVGSASIAVIVSSDRKLRVTSGFVAAGVLALGAIDAFGAPSGASLAERTVASAANAVVAASWVSGVMAEVVRPMIHLAGSR